MCACSQPKGGPCLGPTQQSLDGGMRFGQVVSMLGTAAGMLVCVLGPLGAGVSCAQTAVRAV